MRPRLVPPGQFFVLGDNTRNSWDSRYWGGAPVRNLLGRAMVVWWPLDGLRPVQ